jgi:hypothetical protein
MKKPGEVPGSATAFRPKGVLRLWQVGPDEPAAEIAQHQVLDPARGWFVFRELASPLVISSA